MRIIYNKKRNSWRIELEDKRHVISINDFLVLTGLRDRNDRRFHHISELIFSSKIEENYFRKGLSNLKKTSLIHSKGNYYKISEIGEKVVDMIRKENFETLENKRNLIFSLDSLKKLLGLKAE
ncbi:MAG: hypothetical protein QXD55_00745 [Candidatus Aenigmatarchaeota archaeon]